MIVSRGYRHYVATETRQVRNKPDARRFELLDSAGRIVGVCDYYIDGDVVVLPHTEIVPELRGNGLGAELVQGVLDDVRSRGAQVRPLCWFVVEFIDEHPQYADLVAG
jgi:predicted GNAT family acetyltransferase